MPRLHRSRRDLAEAPPCSSERRGRTVARREPLLDFSLFRHLEEQRQSFDQILAGFGHCLALAPNVKLWAKGHVAVAFPLNDCRQLHVLACSHTRLLPHGSGIRRASAASLG